MDINLTYRLPTLTDQDVLRAYVEEHYLNGEPDIRASMNLTSMNYASCVDQINRNIDIPNGDWGRSYTLLCFDEKILVGLLSIKRGKSVSTTQLSYNAQSFERFFY